MGFIERLRQEKEAEALIIQQQEEQLKQQGEAVEKSKTSAEAIEKERHARRWEQARKFNKESGIEVAVAELRNVLGAVPSDPFPDIVLRPKDSDSVFNSISWETRVERTSSKEMVGIL